MADAKPSILFAFRGKKAVAILVGYTKLACAVFARG